MNYKTILEGGVLSRLSLITQHNSSLVVVDREGPNMSFTLQVSSDGVCQLRGCVLHVITWKYPSGN